jgi:hypothetical protein
MWIRSATFSMLLSEASWSRNSYHSACSAWASLKWGRWRAGVLPLLLLMRRGAIWSGEGGTR